MNDLVEYSINNYDAIIYTYQTQKLSLKPSSSFQHTQEKWITQNTWLTAENTKWFSQVNIVPRAAHGFNTCPIDCMSRTQP